MMRQVMSMRKLTYPLLALMVAVMLLSMACGGEGGDPPATDRSMPTPTTASEPDTPAEPTGVLRPDIREFVNGFCAALSPDRKRGDTWGDLATWLQLRFEGLQSLETPNEMEGMLAAILEHEKLLADFVRGQDPDEAWTIAELSEFSETAEMKAVEEAVNEAQEAVDPDIRAALNEC